MNRRISYYPLTILAVLLLAAMTTGMLVQQEQVQRPWKLLRAEADENTDTIDLTTEGDFASMPSGAVQIKANDDGTGTANRALQFAICAGKGADKTLSWKLYSWRATNGMAELAAYGTATTGTQTVVKYPHNATAPSSTRYWCDTISVTAYTWPMAVKSTDSSGSNNVATLWLSKTGHEYWYMEITDANSSETAEANSVSVYYSDY